MKTSSIPLYFRVVACHLSRLFSFRWSWRNDVHCSSCSSSSQLVCFLVGLSGYIFLHFAAFPIYISTLSPDQSHLYLCSLLTLLCPGGTSHMVCFPPSTDLAIYLGPYYFCDLRHHHPVPIIILHL